MKMELVKSLESSYLTINLFQTAEIRPSGYGPARYVGPYKVVLEVLYLKNTATVKCLHDLTCLVPTEILVKEIDCNHDFFATLFCWFFNLGIFIDDLNHFLSLSSDCECRKLQERLGHKSRFLSNSQFGLFTRYFKHQNREHFLSFTLIDLNSATITTVDAFSAEAMQFYKGFK